MSIEEKLDEQARNAITLKTNQHSVLLDNILNFELFATPIHHDCVLQNVSEVIKNLCKFHSTLSIESVRQILIPLSVLIFHQDEKIFMNACQCYNLLMHPSKSNKDYSADFLLFFGVPSLTVFTFYQKKQQQDGLVFNKTIKIWEKELNLQIPDVLCDTIKRYFMLFDDQRLEQMKHSDLLHRIVEGMDVDNIQIQQIVLETINNLCSEIDIYPLADQAIDYGILL